MGFARKPDPDMTKGTLMTPAEVMILAKISRTTFYRLVKANRLPVVMIGQQMRVKPEVVAKLMTEGV